MRIKIRKFRPGDVEECGKIATENVVMLFQDIQSPVATWDYIRNHYPSNFLKSCMKSKRGREVWVVEDIKTKEILGYVRFERAKRKKRTGHIGNLFTRYELRGKGIGAELTKFAEERIKKKFKANKIQLYSVYISPTIKFYEKMGYEQKGKIQRVGPRYIKKKNRTKAIFMEKKLD